MTTTSNIITALYDNAITVSFTQDAWFNATAVAKQYSKRTEDYLRLDRTKDYISALKKALFSVAGNPVTEQNQLVEIVQGGKPENQGTWLHPKLAIDFARWLNADFAVWCDMQIEKILHAPKEKSIFKPQPMTTPLHPTMMTVKMKAHIQHVINLSVHETNQTTNKVVMDLARFFYVDNWELIPMSYYPQICAYFEVEPLYEVEATNNWVMIDAAELGQLRAENESLKQGGLISVATQKTVHDGIGKVLDGICILDRLL